MNPTTLLLLNLFASEPTSADAQSFAVIAEPSESPREVKRSVTKGRPTELESGAPHGVWIWRVGDRWHVRTTTKSAEHRFTGIVSVPEKSDLKGIAATKIDMKDRIKLRERAIQFDFTTHGHEDGFDFTVEGKGCVRFAIEVDGDKDPALVKLGKRSVRPESWHFKVCR